MIRPAEPGDYDAFTRLFAVEGDALLVAAMVALGANIEFELLRLSGPL